jgi:hypothetical protein
VKILINKQTIMKFRNSWKSATKQWDKISIRFRLSSVDVFTLEIDISREFYMLTILNLTIKNR